VKLGVLTLQNAPWPELVQRWRTLEELGVETIWVADHLANWMHPEQPWFEAWSCVTALAHLTERPRIGTLVSPMTLRNPAVLARTALTVAELSGGRLELGVGAGRSGSLDHELSEATRWEPGQRAALFTEWADRLVELIEDERFQPKANVPLTVAGRGKAILAVAARYATRWNTFGGVGLTPDEAVRRGREDNGRLDELCAETGRTVLRSALLGYSFVGETPWQSDDACADLVGRWGEAGFEELIVYYPPETGMPPGSVAPGVFERALVAAQAPGG
jgi:alkanesulfonate monooxygenase SsuD/methylene tetrahydromethanopterin reductase-like flavin-dependent oxidoreductase (luciferase family)